MTGQDRPITNDTVALTPVTSFGPPVLALDFPGLLIGVAEYAEGPTGCTVFHFPEGAQAVADIRGGAPATFHSECLSPGPGYVDAICLAGGSSYGLEAAAGVAAELFATRGYSRSWGTIAMVAGAIIFDYRPRDNAIYPDKELGRAALRSAQAGVFPLGARGAGCSATVGKCALSTHEYESSGQGGAFQRAGPVRVAVFSVVNAMGAVVDRGGSVVRGHRHAKTGKRERLRDLMVQQGEGNDVLAAPAGNTTLTVVITNLDLAHHSLRQLARQVHGSMSRAIEPFHALRDGDVLYAVTTGEIEEAGIGEEWLAITASELAWDAVLSSAPSNDTSAP